MRSEGSPDCETALRYFKSLDATFVELDSGGSLIGLDSHSKFTDEAMTRLSGCKKLEYLSLVGAPITDAGVTNLAKNPKLRRLVLNRSLVTDKALDQIGRMTNLQELDLGWTKVSDASIDQLTRLKGLNSLLIENTLISREGASRLKIALPTTTILY